MSKLTVKGNVTIDVPGDKRMKKISVIIYCPFYWIFSLVISPAILISEITGKYGRRSWKEYL
jgi:hypothetical protein